MVVARLCLRVVAVYAHYHLEVLFHACLVILNLMAVFLYGRVRKDVDVDLDHLGDLHWLTSNLLLGDDLDHFVEVVVYPLHLLVEEGACPSVAQPLAYPLVARQLSCHQDNSGSDLRVEAADAYLLPYGADHQEKNACLQVFDEEARCPHNFF